MPGGTQKCCSGGSGETSRACPLSMGGWRVLQETAEIAEAQRGVEPLRHGRGLQAGRFAATVPCVVELCRGHRGGEPTPPWSAVRRKSGGRPAIASASHARAYSAHEATSV